MELLCEIMAIALVGLVIHTVVLRVQLRRVDRQLRQRLSESSRRPVSLQLSDKGLSRLVSDINRCLKAEERHRLRGIDEEKRFRELIANISHDLRTPLTAIDGYQQLMAKGELDESQQANLATARKHTAEMTRLLEQFFEYSCAISAEKPPEPTRVNLTNLAAESIAAHVPAFEEKGIRVRLLDEAPVFAMCDAGMTRRLVGNLVRNCLQHSAGDVTCAVEQRGEQALLVFTNPVSDPAAIDTTRLFERFYTGDSARNRASGLGLSIVSLLAGQMGGEAAADIDDGALSITIKLPAFIKKNNSIYTARHTGDQRRKTNMDVLKVKGLVKEYELFRLNEVSFSVPESSITGFIGRNGAGKTTTLRSLLDMVHPNAGQIEFFGMPFSENESEIKKDIGFVSGGADYYPRTKLKTIAAVTKSFYESWDDAAFARYMKMFKLDGEKRIKELSAGMKVKFSLALALSHRARLLILDEPTSGLDPVSRDDLLDVFIGLVDSEKVSILFSTHITSDLERCADRIVYIKEGTIIAEEKTDAFTESYRLVDGASDQLTERLDKALIGRKKTRGGFEGLIKAEDESAAEGLKISPADLQSIMVFTEKEEYSFDKEGEDK